MLRGCGEQIPWSSRGALKETEGPSGPIGVGLMDARCLALKDRILNPATAGLHPPDVLCVQEAGSSPPLPSHKTISLGSESAFLLLVHSVT